MGSSCGGGAEVAAKLAELSLDASDGAGSEDRLSALPDDMLVLILGRLNTTSAAVRTSVLSRRWRHVWALLPELYFYRTPDPLQIGAALEAHEAALLRLFVVTQDAGPDSVAAWLPIAARRVSGHLFFLNLGRESNAQQEGDGEEAAQKGAFELPCLERATDVCIYLGFLGLVVPPAGVFARLTQLSLERVRLYGPGDLGDAVSWPRCPCLQELAVSDASGLENLVIHSDSLRKVELSHLRGLENLAIHSDSLRQVELTNLRGLQQLNIVAAALRDLQVSHCFCHNRSKPVASITAPQLATLGWIDPYDPTSVHLGEMRHLRLLKPAFVVVYGDDKSSRHNRSCLSLLRRFKVIEYLKLGLLYMLDIDDRHYILENMTMLPDITVLELSVLANGHAFGASAFHVLRMCSRIEMLMLSFVPPTEVKAQTTCPPGCICGEHQNWETEHLLLNRLKEVEVTQMRGSEHEVTFVKQLFNWATSLEKMRVVFDVSVDECVTKELSQVLRSFAWPGIVMEIHTYMEDIKL